MIVCSIIWSCHVSFYKQKTAYELRISDWSSDVCSSDLTSNTGGRNHHGRITTRHIGGGHKQHYRLIDFKRDKEGIPARVERIEYDPNRTAHIALVCYADGERRYIIAPKGMKAGDQEIGRAHV